MSEVIALIVGGIFLVILGAIIGALYRDRNSAVNAVEVRGKIETKIRELEKELKQIENSRAPISEMSWEEKIEELRTRFDK